MTIVINQSTRFKAYFLLLLTNLFFAFQFIPRLSLGILREDIMVQFNLQALDFGVLSGYYYLGYSLMQIPIGIMLDKYSFRLVTSFSVLMCAIGIAIFVASDNLFHLSLGRFIMGVGSGAGFLCVVKVIKSYYKTEYQAILIGCSFSFGLIGAVFGITPMKICFDYLGLEVTFQALIVICLIIASLILCFGSSELSPLEGEEATAQNIIKLLLNPVVLITGVSGGLMVGSLEGFADLWALSYFVQAFGMSQIDSNIITSCVYFGMCVGGPILALLSSIVGSVNVAVLFTGLLTIAVFSVLFALNSISFIFAVFLMFLLGILCCYQSLVFTGVTSYVSPNLSGLAIAITNCINMSFGYLFHVAIAKTIQSNWDGAVLASGAPIYSKENFVYSLSIIPICGFVGVLGFFAMSYYSKLEQKV